MKKNILLTLIVASILFLIGCNDVSVMRGDFLDELSADAYISADDDTDAIDSDTNATNDDDLDDLDATNDDDLDDLDATNDDISATNDDDTSNATDSEDGVDSDDDTAASETADTTIDEDGIYTDKDNVALYIHTYDKLPSNYITKGNAQEKGWNNRENTMAEVLPGMSIGGDRFGNYEGSLPKKQGRTYKECDIDYEKGGRNAKRIVYSNDGLIFYTEDHYNSFEQIY